MERLDLDIELIKDADSAIPSLEGSPCFRENCQTVFRIRSP
jgi:hypothetical protein